ncbi:hypothetical protein PROFUN_11415 [Planoprotostelium fungivorum]|uniref:Uncharacterized protein n=1 Tax=Planoprotostelium fungivorum TaxID=1890364 RepID=A0A2P6NA94_9EUKA|nr:hypothetical protein PROFUN_11415 [Planoprotostelium fungivorum]
MRIDPYWMRSIKKITQGSSSIWRLHLFNSALCLSKLTPYMGLSHAMAFLDPTDFIVIVTLLAQTSLKPCLFLQILPWHGFHPMIVYIKGKPELVLREIWTSDRDNSPSFSSSGHYKLKGRWSDLMESSQYGLPSVFKRQNASIRLSANRSNVKRNQIGGIKMQLAWGLMAGP